MTILGFVFEQFYQRSLLGMDYVTNMNKCPLNSFKFLSSCKSEHKHTTSVIEVVAWEIMRLIGVIELIQSKVRF